MISKTTNDLTGETTISFTVQDKHKGKMIIMLSDRVRVESLQHLATGNYGSIVKIIDTYLQNAFDAIDTVLLLHSVLSKKRTPEITKIILDSAFVQDSYSRGMKKSRLEILQILEGLAQKAGLDLDKVDDLLNEGGEE